MGAFWAPAMVTQEQAVEIKVLARRGVAIREIARQLGCSRNTVKRYLNDANAVRYGPRSPRPTKLDPFKAYVLERIEAARPHWIPAAVLHRELRERGYSGGGDATQDDGRAVQADERGAGDTFRDSARATNAGGLH